MRGDGRRGSYFYYSGDIGASLLQDCNDVFTACFRLVRNTSFDELALLVCRDLARDVDLRTGDDGLCLHAVVSNIPCIYLVPISFHPLLSFHLHIPLSYIVASKDRVRITIGTSNWSDAGGVSSVARLQEYIRKDQQLRRD